MAAEFLRSHGVDIDAEMQRIQFGEKGERATDASSTGRTTRITNASLPNTPPGSRWTVHLDPSSGSVGDVQVHTDQSTASSTQDNDTHIDAHGALLAPSLCHPHVHLDKAYLLSHTKYVDLQIQRGDFAEAMELTGKAKAQFEHDDLIERGQRLIDESVAAGVTHMRAFVELDAGVWRKCLDAGLELKRAAEGRCVVQICAFAQLPLFSASRDDPNGSVIRDLIEEAAGDEGVDVLGSTPYVEGSREKMEQNVDWLVDLAIEHNKHTDFHLDYNLDPDTEPLVWHVMATLRKKHWTSYNANRMIVLGHCTRLTLFSANEWRRLKTEIGGLPINFVGLPTSDLFMMRTENRVRGTLDVPRLVQDSGLNAWFGYQQHRQRFHASWLV